MDILLKKKKRKSRLEATARIEVRLQPPTLGGYTEINFDELCDELDIVDKRTGDEDAEFVDDEEELGDESDASSTASGAPAARQRRPGAGGEAGERMATALMRKGVGYDLDDPFVDDSDLHVSIPQPNASGHTRAARDRFPLFGGFFVNAADEIEAAPVEADEPAVAEAETSGADVPKKQRRSRKIQLEEVDGATAEANNGVETTAPQEFALTQPTATSDEKQRKRKAAGDPQSGEPKRMVGRAPNAKKAPRKELEAPSTAGDAEKPTEQPEAPSPAAPPAAQSTTAGGPPPSVPPIKQRRRPGPRPKEKPKDVKKRRIMTTTVPNTTPTERPAPQPTVEPSAAPPVAPAAPTTSTAPTAVELPKAKSPQKPPAVPPAPTARKSPVPSTSGQPPTPDAGPKLMLLKTFLERAKTFKEEGGSPDVRAELEQMAVVLFGSNTNAKQWTGAVPAKTSANGTSGSSLVASKPPGSSTANPPARSPAHPPAVAVETATSSSLATSVPTPPKPTVPVVPPSAAPPTPPKAEASRPTAPMRMAGLFKPRPPRPPTGSLVGRPPTAKRKVGISFPETPEKNPPVPPASLSFQPPPTATRSAGSKSPQSIPSIAPKVAPPSASQLPPPAASSTPVLPNSGRSAASSGLQPQASVRAASPRTAAISNGTPASRPANGVQSAPPKSNGQPAAANSQTAARAEVKRPSNPPTASAASSTPKATFPQFQLTAQQQAAILEQLKGRPIAEIQRLYAALGAQMEAATKAAVKPPAPSKPPASAAKSTIPKPQQPPQRAAPVQKPKPPLPAAAQPPPAAPISRPNVSIATNGTAAALPPQAAGLQLPKPPVPCSSSTSNANRCVPTGTPKAAVDPKPLVPTAVPAAKSLAPPRPPPPAVQQPQVDAAMLRGYEQQLNALYAAQIQSISALQFAQMSPQQQRVLLAAVPQLLAQQQLAAASSAAAATRKS